MKPILMLVPFRYSHYQRDRTFTGDLYQDNNGLFHLRYVTRQSTNLIQPEAVYSESDHVLHFTIGFYKKHGNEIQLGTSITIDSITFIDQEDQSI